GAGARPSAPVPHFETPIPSEVLPPLAAREIAPAAESESTFDDAIWGETPSAGEALAGDAVFELDPSWLFSEAPAETPAAGDPAAAAPTNDEPGAEAPVAAPAATFESDWMAVRDANIRPYVEWRAS